MKIANKKIEELTPYENNPRRNDEAVPYVAASIKEFGFKVPLVVDKDGVVVSGHTRLKAAKKLGLTEVPCVIADDLTEEQIKAFRLADNKVGEIAKWDDDMLAGELEGLDLDFDMSDFGFVVEDIKTDPTETERESINLNETISVVVRCEDDAQAEELFERLTEEGYSCTISTL